MRSIAIAGIQMKLSATEDNLPAIGRQIDLALHRFPWIQMVVLSELAGCGPLTATAQPLPGPAEAGFQDMARRNGIWLVNGSFFERASDKVYNTTSVIDPTGAVVGRYRKLFPFRPYEQGVEAGDQFFTFDVPGIGRFGCIICYDIWFPEVSRTLAAMGAEVILRPTLTDTIDREMELTVSKAMAAINQCYIVDINGLDAGGYGRSIIVDPDGLVLHQAGTDEEIIPLELDLDKVQRVRERGFKGLAQTLKSFRDRSVAFPLYQPGGFDLSYLNALGPLHVPARAPARPAAASEAVISNIQAVKFG